MDLLTEVENLREVIDREAASVKVLLSASCSDDQMENDDICLMMRDCDDRMKKAKEILDRIEKIATEGGQEDGEREDNQRLC